jgi:tRNA modification GTPase
MPVNTIYALATGAGRSAIAVIRLSGGNARRVLEAVAGSVPAPREARLTRFADPSSGETLDQGLCLWFPGPHSPTGEDYAEVQIHGGRAVIDAFLTALNRFPGLREAEPGEFARRGFASGKIDLSQVEALADLIDSQTEFQRRQALRITGGDLRRRVESWRGAIVEALALVEAELDFAEEEDVGVAAQAKLGHFLRPILGEMQECVRRAPASERLRDGYVVFILGPPNAGKSTLMNALAQRDIAIVSEIPGTTRDLLEAHLDIVGMPVTFVDTAGLREASDEIEKLGVSRTKERARHADLLLWLSEGGAESPPDDILERGFESEMLHVSTKLDQLKPPLGWMAISARTGAGLDQLFEAILTRAKQRLGDGSTSLLLRQRHRDAVKAAMLHIEEGLAPKKPLEIVADDLRAAGRSLGRIVGAVDVEDVLDAIFSQFCIGK